MTQNTSQRIRQEVSIKFADEHKLPILRGKKTATIRVGWGPEKLPVGSPILMCDDEGDWFAEAEVVERVHTTVEEAAKMDFDGHRNYSSVAELIEELRGYYLGEEIDPATRVEIVKWGELW